MCSNIDVNREEIYATGAEAVTTNVSVWYLHVPEIHNYHKIKSSEIFSSQRKKESQRSGFASVKVTKTNIKELEEGKFYIVID